MKYFFSYLFLSAILVTSGQEIFESKLLDQETQQPVAFAVIHDVLRQRHTHSNEFGYFKISIQDPEDSLIVSHVGYDALVIIPKNHHGATIALKPNKIMLDQLIVTPGIDGLQTITNINLKVEPVNSSQDILRKIPGLFIAQHAGGGKAEQIFLRGFDIDHGTDVQITADGLPVNMVSHAHGQGYADLHFLIPETIERVDFEKGPYDASKGNFATAGHINYRTFDKVGKSMIKLERGQFNTSRLIGLIDLLGKDQDENAYLATSYQTSDGPFESPQNFGRFNFFTKYNKKFGDHQLTLQASTFSSTWDASGQIPERAVADGSISRFGAIDDTEGGTTSRHDIGFQLVNPIDQLSFFQSKGYFTRYTFELYSNFTFFLEDPINGDQIRQKEKRNIYGFETTYNRQLTLASYPALLRMGVGLRLDHIEDIELSHTLNRQTVMEQLKSGDIREANTYLHADIEWTLGLWLINPGLRWDELSFQYNDHLSSVYQTAAKTKDILSPKLKIVYTPSGNWQFFAKAGRGFHSNDTRVSVTNTQNTLPAAWGSDIGTSFSPSRKIWVNVAYWILYLEQEFVYVGDAGIVEPSGKTLRQGVDVGINLQPNPWLYIDANVNLAKPRFLQVSEQSNLVPLAPNFTSTGGLIVEHPSGIAGSLRYRYIKDRSANEDNSIVAEGYFISDVSLSYTHANIDFGIRVLNLFDTHWNEAQFETESQLRDETSPVSELHFTPGTPRTISASIGIHF
ncbi:MAG: TonB-dependent receptor [Cyclobacteriaceae bacterium]|nr:TonB-dependent receptor [Cyclobacteriaceae bacterium HetDA_MAG_MS6]